MDCRAARDWLLQADRPGAWSTDPTAPAGHLHDCTTCRNLAVELERLEADYRDQPLPASIEQAREAFLARLRIPLAKPRGWRRFLRPRWGLAASVLLLAGLSAYLWWPRTREPAEPDGAPDVVERLVDWNLALAHSDHTAGRHPVEDNQGPELRSAMVEADLPDDDRELAESLLETGEFIAVEDDPMARVDRFDDLADKLLAQIDAATSKKDAKRLRKLAKLYRRIAEQGIHVNLDQIEEGGLNAERAKKFDRLVRREAARADKLMRLLEKAPRASRKELRKAIAPPRKPHRNKKHRKR